MSDLVDGEAAPIEYRSRAATLDYMRSLKERVANDIEAMDPTVTVKFTDYFNHSYVPDMVVSWAKNEAAREVYLRGSIEGAIIAGDLVGHGEEGPMIVSVGDKRAAEVMRDEPKLAARVRKQVRRSPHALLTEIPALTALKAGDDSGSPLQKIVRTSVVRGARGILDEDSANQLTSVASPGDAAQVDQVISSLFVEREAAQIQRVGALVTLGTRGADDDNSLPEGEEMLSATELQAYLPWVLRQENRTASPTFWRWLGSQFDLGTLQSLAPSLKDVDLTPLVHANLEDWTGRGVGLVIADVEEPADAGTWVLRSGMLSARFGPWRLHLTESLHKLRSREPNAAARWEELAVAVENFEVRGVNLNGLSVRHDIQGESSVDVLAEIRRVVETTQDSFQSPAILVEDLVYEDVMIHVNLERLLAESKNPPASLLGLVDVSAKLLAHRSPASSDDLAALQGNRS